MGLGGWLFVLGVIDADAGRGGGGQIVGGSALGLVGVLLAASLAIVAPGQTRVVQFFGRYIGTVRKPGLRMVVPLSTRRNVSVRVHNFETNELKVNDSDGNPINIAAIVVWQVADTARAKFAVEDYEDFVAVQAESALRHVAMSHPYDNAATEVTLRGDTEIISAELATEVAERIALAGLEVIEVRISALAYAPEIAQAMLQRQQASAVIAAREKIVEGAVGMVESALEQLERKDIVELDAERKAAMVSNLLTVLCSERGTTPVVNTGSLYT
jgi:regulator of protease activity HflC (stomatin/prohibitin superfamily)